MVFLYYGIVFDYKKECSIGICFVRRILRVVKGGTYDLIFIYYLRYGNIRRGSRLMVF